MMMRALVWLMAVLLAGCGAVPVPPPPPPAVDSGADWRAARPQRIVSINPCVDAMLRELADPQQIRAISHYSVDPRATSVPLDWAGGFAVTSGTAEEVVAMRPDLVLAGLHVAPATVAALGRLGVPVVMLGVPNSVAESQAQIAEVGALIGHPDRAAGLSARIDVAVAAAEASLREGSSVPALIWQGGGLVPGPTTLADAMLAASGHHNHAGTLGLGAWDVLGLERLVASPPALLYAGDRPGEGERLRQHPVLGRLESRIVIAPFPGRLLFCAGPTIIDALDHLTASRKALDAG
jgi:iron complex transport system substrate-binding protein